MRHGDVLALAVVHAGRVSNARERSSRTRSGAPAAGARRCSSERHSSRNGSTRCSSSSRSRPSASRLWRRTCGELVDDPLGVVGAHRKLDPLAQPCDGELVLSDLVVGEAGGVVEPDVVGIRGLQLGPDRSGLFLVARRGGGTRRCRIAGAGSRPSRARSRAHATRSRRRGGPVGRTRGRGRRSTRASRARRCRGARPARRGSPAPRRGRRASEPARRSRRLEYRTRAAERRRVVAICARGSEPSPPPVAVRLWPTMTVIDVDEQRTGAAGGAGGGRHGSRPLAAGDGERRRCPADPDERARESRRARDRRALARLVERRAVRAAAPGDGTCPCSEALHEGLKRRRGSSAGARASSSSLPEGGSSRPTRSRCSTTSGWISAAVTLSRRWSPT